MAEGIRTVNDYRTPEQKLQKDIMSSINEGLRASLEGSADGRYIKIIVPGGPFYLTVSREKPQGWR